MITLDLTKEETFMLRDLATGADCGYEWMQEIACLLYTSPSPRDTR